MNLGEVQRPELIPFSHDREPFGILHGRIRIIEVRYIFEHLAGVGHTFGIIRMNHGACIL